MAVLKTTQLQRLVADARQTLDWLDKHAQTISRRANDDADTGFGSGHNGGRSTGVNRPVERKALTRTVDDVRTQAARLRTCLEHAARELRIAQQAGSSLLALPDVEAHNLATQDELNDDGTMSAECANPACGVLVARTPNDRLRSGRCDACYRYRRRTGDERPRHLCDADKPVAKTVEDHLAEMLAGIGPADTTTSSGGDTLPSGDIAH